MEGEEGVFLGLSSPSKFLFADFVEIFHIWKVGLVILRGIKREIVRTWDSEGARVGPMEFLGSYTVPMFD